jgi:hypothetical protein
MKEVYAARDRGDAGDATQTGATHPDESSSPAPG